MAAEYRVRKGNGLAVADDPILIDQFPWYESGLKQNTFVKMSYTDETVTLYVHCEDQHPSASCLNYGDSVYVDSCFEWFFSPTRDEDYINIEINCFGTLYMAFGNGDVDSRLVVAYDIAREVQIHSTFSPNQEGDTVDYWDLEVKVPFATIEKILGKKVDIKIWTSNFYRCGGEIEPQYASWSWINHPTPSFHQPNDFGILHFI